ncbi:hypothetical protein ACFWZW_03490 [Microbacterium enclense]|uniref:hypothetical protein n=1 Tax=Microbacterium enclense TaxID=993073 RepID=UPI0036DBFF92
MTMPAASGNASRAMHFAVTDLAATWLRSAGFEDAAPRPYHAKISDALDEGVLGPDVRGISGVHLRVSTRGSFRLGGDLDDARRAAALSNRGEVAALLQLRRGGSAIAESFVLVTLEDFARLLGGTPPP